MRYARETIILKTRSEVKLTVTKIVNDILPFQDAFTHQTWDALFKDYRRYSLDMNGMDRRILGQTVQLLYMPSKVPLGA